MHHPHFRDNSTLQSAYYIIVIVSILSVALGTGIWRYIDTRPSDQYHAVFLENGQVYFGKISHRHSRYVHLQDVYYFQIDPNSQNAETPTNPDLSLVRLGSELHGPTNEMHIEHSHVMFIETLRDNSEVIRAILDAQ